MGKLTETLFWNTLVTKPPLYQNIASLQKYLTCYKIDSPENNLENNIYPDIPYYKTEVEWIYPAKKIFYGPIAKFKKERKYMEKVWKSSIQTEDTGYSNVHVFMKKP